MADHSQLFEGLSTMELMKLSEQAREAAKRHRPNGCLSSGQLWIRWKSRRNRV